ncbi:class I SAM-dependent methyltransferase [uncultured Caulobacter sp.]|uniref:class I SAM-dependent methyltransferase n=1 Tax=uncultured Caulobacter sp. TaxID=158749 RepID=UPI00261721A5|nr:class I SAM-dependent methyltransferase [uncultured Caulobacter sp.]
MKSILKSAASLLPPAVRRAASGAVLDLASLPERLRDPDRRDEPWQTLHNVGGGDFAAAGRHNLDLLTRYAGLTPSSRVLDIGCGAGRMAAPLVYVLGANGGYVGFDVSRAAIRACRQRLGRARPDFRFVHADVRNREYRASGAVAETAFVFPTADGEIDIAMATSVFSHMRLDSIAHYLREAARSLKPGGRFLFTAFALTEERVARIEAGRSPMRFKPWKDGAWVVDPRSPERAIAHPLSALKAATAAAGLDLPNGVAFGCWLPPSAYSGGQDLFIAVKPPAGSRP